jgi:hypothetical protein
MMARRKKTRAIVIIGRVWCGKYGCECTASVYVNGDQVATLPPERGAENYAIQRAKEWLDEHGFLPELERYRWGGTEALHLYCNRNGITLIRETANVERMKDL